MDQDAFRETYREINECFCIYEKPILMNRCHCPQAARFCIAEREGVECRSLSAQQQCREFLDSLRENARFALKSRSPETPLPHAKAMRLLMGGLLGLHRIRYPGDPTPVLIANVHGLLNDCIGHFGGIQRLPFARIIQQLAEYREPRRRTRRQRDKGPPEDT
ncbi:MAG: hypothetical protein H7842_01835 [Gammaproteobacteria bacterium SHHR-1]|uniref:hypothetical protein n=1 Tax=Magnetovirga frankeli TaxID=947516 RepID=UPI0012937238|nr:hypothetical protein D5125_15980 [gamma proteobacterium SS-5]